MPLQSPALVGDLQIVVRRSLFSLSQPGVELLERGSAGAEFGLGQCIQRGRGGVHIGVHVCGLRVDIEKPGDDLAFRLSAVEEVHCLGSAMDVVITSEFSQAEQRAIMLRHNLDRAGRVIDGDFFLCRQ